MKTKLTHPQMMDLIDNSYRHWTLRENGEEYLRLVIGGDILTYHIRDKNAEGKQMAGLVYELEER